MLSFDTIKKYIDKYIYFDEKYNTVIVACDKYIAKMPISEKKMLINGEEKDIEVTVQYSGDDIYIPIEELSHVYDIDIIYNEKVIITTKNMDHYSIAVNNKIHTKKYKKQFALTTDIVSKGESIEIYDEYTEKGNDEYLWVRTANGSFGYVKKSAIKVLDDNIKYIEAKKDIDTEKVTMTWEYAGNYTPNRTAEERINGLDIISPTWLYTKKGGNGSLSSKVDESYINWAKEQGYKLWPAVVNSGGIDDTSIILNDMKNRENLINQIITLCEKYNFSGINMDFENMYKDDKDEYSQLIRELSCSLRYRGIVSSVDVNVPDGSDTWSLCYDSKAISDSADYIVLMAYDQHGASSQKAGPVASYEWVEGNLKKMIERDKIESKKLILGIPFYSRIWKTKNGIVEETTALSMKGANNYLNRSNKWDEDAKQYLVEYTSNGYKVQLWVENKDSIKEKMKLVENYNLAGIASWRMGYETEDIWDIVCDI